MRMVAFDYYEFSKLFKKHHFQHDLLNIHFKTRNQALVNYF